MAEIALWHDLAACEAFFSITDTVNATAAYIEASYEVPTVASSPSKTLRHRNLSVLQLRTPKGHALTNHDFRSASRAVVLLLPRFVDADLRRMPD